MTIENIKPATTSENAQKVDPGPVGAASCMGSPSPASASVGMVDLQPPDCAETPGFVTGKHLAIVVSAGSSRHLVEHVRRRFESLGANADLVIPAQSDRVFDDRTEIDASHTLSDKASTEFDFVVVLPGPGTSPDMGDEITAWTHPLREQSKPLAIGAQAAELLGVDIDNAKIFDVSTCDAFVQTCNQDAKARDAQRPV